MPERPKRRKNKNKRKNNKNTNIDLNKNNIVESDTPNVESSSDVINEENIINVDGEKDDLFVTTEISSTSNDVCQADITQIDTTTKLKDEIQVIPSTSQVCATSNSNDSGVLQHGEEIIPTPEIRSIDNENYIIKPSDSSKQTNSNELIPSDICVTSKECDVDSVVKQTDKELQKYIVETPDNTTKVKCKLDNEKKSKSCDNDDCPTIVEITDDFNIQSENDNSLAAIDNSNVIITGEESDIEWEKVDHFNLPQTNLIKGVLSCDTIPLNIVHCEQITTLSPQEELSLRNYLKTLNLSTSSSDLNAGDIKTEIEEIINREIKYRLKKKGLTEENLYTRAGPSRSLAVIDEEGSGDSSKSSKRHSYLSDKISDNEELDDDVFESKQTLTMRRSNIDKRNNSNKCLIPQQCIRVDAKLKEPEITEARGDWSMKTVEKMTGAELVYLTDSSSSTSSIYDVNDETDKGEDTDVSIRMITPTIEVTDTESLLSNTFLSSDKHNISKCDESACEVADIATISISNNTSTTEELNSQIYNSKTQNNANEIVILRTDNIKTNLIVKDINEPNNFKELEEICENNSNKLSRSPKEVDVYDLEIKVLKCELNDAINNLINEVISDSENSKEAPSGTFTRQDSSSSVDSSQCTAKYNPTHSSLNDMSNILQDETSYDSNKEYSQKDTSSSHVKDVLHCVTSNPLPVTEKIGNENFSQPIKLRDMCVKKITSFPFGDKILEELAHVSLRLQNMSALASKNHQLSKIHSNNKTSEKVDISESDNSSKNLFHNDNSNIPPPILPRKSSLKVAQEEPIIVIPKIEAVYECLSPSQKMLMEKTNTVISRDFKSQPNVNIRNEIGINLNDNKISQLSISTPMKSETGSRLLALLRDTSNTHNLNTPLNKPLEDKNLIKMPKLKSDSETFSKRLLDEIDSTKQYKETTSNTTYISTDKLTKVSNSFKPIPPPKPNKSTYYYESDESSDFRQNSFQSMQSNKKYFHFSTGNLSKEIENDISTIQNMHKHCTSLRDQNYELKPRRPSLPKDLCDQQMEYIRQKEKEVDAELHRLEQEKFKSRGPRAPMVSETDNNYCKMFDKSAKSYTNKDFTPIYHTSKNFGSGKLSSVFSRSQEELLREKMYSEYVNQMAEREQRKQQKVIKVTQTHTNSGMASKSMPFLDNSDTKMNNRIEEEFISKARERWCKLGIRDQDTEGDKDIESDLYREPKVIEHKIKVIEGGEEKDVKNLPSHIQEFVKFTVKDKEEESGTSGESDSEKASAHVVVFCAVVILVLTVGRILLQFLRFK